MAEAPAKPLVVVDKRGQPKPVDYRNGVDRRIKKGRWKPHGPRLLVRAILATDGSELTAADDPRFAVEYDPRNAVAWEVLGVGNGAKKFYDDANVPEEQRIKVGDHIMHRSVVADRADINDLKCRFWYLHLEDVLGVDDDPTE
jgi:hypothetical protein